MHLWIFGGAAALSWGGTGVLAGAEPSVVGYEANILDLFTRLEAGSTKPAGSRYHLGRLRRQIP